MKEWKQLNEQNIKLFLTSLCILIANFLSYVCCALEFHVAKLSYLKKKNPKRALAEGFEIGNEYFHGLTT